MSKSLVINKIIAVILIFALGYSPIYSQNLRSNSETVKQIKLFIADKKFENALILSNKLLQSNPNSAEYNYYAGLCMINLNMNNQATIEHLKLASNSNNVPANVNLLLGKAYHNDYLFFDALDNYEKFKDKISKNHPDILLSFQEITRSNNAIVMVSEFNSIKLIEKKTVRKHDFYKSYVNLPENGYFRQIPENLRSKNDILWNSTDFGFFAKNTNTLYFSSYGQNLETGKDIYRSELLPSGKWTEPENLGFAVNSIFDEDFPYISPDGKTIFFSSNSTNSMGGYDIFKSNFILSSGEWSPAINIGFPVNSTSDEFLYIPSTENNIANFSSNREQLAEGIVVYSIYKKTAEVITTHYGNYRNKRTSSNDIQTFNNIVDVVRDASKLWFTKRIKPLSEVIILPDTQNIFALQNLKFPTDTIIPEILEMVVIKTDTIITQSIAVPLPKDANKTNKEVAKTTPANSEVKQVKSTDIKALPVFFTLQIGVFNTEKTSKEVNNLADLFFEKTKNGSYRYFSGHYKTLKEAKTALSVAVEKGFKDAFVVAFNGNVKISTAEALDLLK